MQPTKKYIILILLMAVVLVFACVIGVARIAPRADSGVAVKDSISQEDTVQGIYGEKAPADDAERQRTSVPRGSGSYHTNVPTPSNNRTRLPEGYYSHAPAGDYTLRYDGWFRDNKGTWPVKLTLYHSGTRFTSAHYINVTFKVNLDLNVQESGRSIYISGKAGTSDFRINVTASSDFSTLEGSAQNGGKSLTAGFKLENPSALPNP